ncbi:MAG: ribonucleotide-diphosphate reductase subunit alpha, partial [Candidatus Delongbacteria bacterium]|nr:ribonucleotide-diphosphate reductase subunit alpha [Candidatus Delongbacteria bacterium]
EPGIVFIDKVNKGNTIPGVGKISATNPCGEQPLLPYGSCNLGSINVSNFFVKEDKSIDWDRLKTVVDDSVLFLDNVIEVGKYPIEKIYDIAKANRNIGLGVMGFADLLYKLEVPYNSDEGVTLGKKLMAFIHGNAIEASKKLAEERGSFPNIDKSIYNFPIRNSNVTTVAPTGTIGMLAETSGGIEPNFALVYVKQVMDDNKFLYVNPILKEALVERGIYTDELMEKISEVGRLENIDEIPQDLKDVFVTSQEISPYYHVAMQSGFQEYVDSSISKTVNFDNSATKDDIRDAYLQAYDSACKGITVYRDGCRPYQVLNTGTKTNEDRKAEAEEAGHKPMGRPDVMEGKTYKVNTGEGTMYVTVNTDEGKPFEVFASIGKAGGNAAAMSEA